jgi:hypothetical protein
MDNRSLAHNWANQVKPHGKGSNFFYEGIHLYSHGHHFEVGRIVKTEKGNTIVLLNADSYSVSTNRHQSYARQACNHLESFDFKFRNSRNSFINTRDFTNDDFVRTFNHYGNIVIESSKKAQRSRKYGDLHLKDAVKAVDDWNMLKFYFPKLTKGIKRLTLPSDLQIKKLNDKDKAERAKERKEKQERIKREEKAWLNYERNYVSRVAKCLLRQRQVKTIQEPGFAPQTRLINEVETSHGARVPLDHARVFYKAITRFKANPKECDERLKVGNFRLDRLSNNGAHIGCHFIEWSEMERFAKTMNW